jgi:hypothetical protein
MGILIRMRLRVDDDIGEEMGKVILFDSIKFGC